MRAVRSDAVGVFCARGFKQQRRSARCKCGHGELRAVRAGKDERSVLERSFGSVLHGHGKDSLKLIVASVLDKRAVNRSDPGKDDPVPEIDGKRGRVVPVSAVLTAVRSFRAVGDYGRIPGGCGCFRTVGAAPRDVRIIRRIGGRIDLRNAAVPICESGAEVPSLPAKSEIISVIRISAAAADTAIAILKRGLIFFWFPSFISVLRIVKYLQPPPAVILSINKLSANLDLRTVYQILRVEELIILCRNMVAVLIVLGELLIASRNIFEKCNAYTGELKPADSVYMGIDFFPASCGDVGRKRKAVKHDFGF